MKKFAAPLSCEEVVFATVAVTLRFAETMEDAVTIAEQAMIRSGEYDAGDMATMKNFIKDMKNKILIQERITFQKQGLM
jgi:hypothetical protein